MSKNTKKSHIGLIIFIIILVLAIAGGAGFYFYQGILKSIVNNPNVFRFVTSLITIVLSFITY